MHNAQRFFFVLPHDVPETVGQPGWRFCHKFLKRSFYPWPFPYLEKYFPKPIPMPEIDTQPLPKRIFLGSNGCHRRDGVFSTECLDHWEHFPAPEVKSFLNNGEMEVKKIFPWAF
jgi:hypothetical protein